MLITASWDRKILFWDLRTKKPIYCISGANCYGDCLDVFDGILLSCHNRTKNQIMLHDLNSRNKIPVDYTDFFNFMGELDEETSKYPTYLNFG